uniref:Uncharacterized protein LOC114344650 n=1 Tax=Diabrotica virgifera virgifera TaxID=50390 RepID=A0A6P7H0N6_DIAVI
MNNDDSEISRLALQVEALQSKLEVTSKKKTNIQDLKKNTTCNYCKRKGNWVRECRKRIHDSKNQDKNKSSESNLASSSAYICDISSMYLSTSSANKSEWICDSGASLHMTGEKLLFSKLESLSEPTFVRIANDKLIPAEGKGRYPNLYLLE